MKPLLLSAATLSSHHIGWLVAALLLLGLLSLFIGYPPGRLKDSPLRAREQALILAVADTFFSRGGPIPLSGTEANALAYFDAYFQRCPRHQQVLIRLLLVSTELGPLVFGPRPRRFTRLSPTQRTRFFAEAFESPLYFRRLSFISLRAIMTMAYLAHPEVIRHMNMSPNTNPFNLKDAA